MKNKTTILIALILIIIFAVVFFTTRSDKHDLETVTTENATQEKKDASLFELEDYEGNTYVLKDFRTDIIVVNSWASWCPFCVNELPDFKKLKEAYEDKVSIVAINRAEPTQTAKSFSDGLNLEETITFLVDPTDSFYKSIGGFAMPETLFLNKKGEVLLQKKGPMKFEEMESILKGILED